MNQIQGGYGPPPPPGYPQQGYAQGAPPQYPPQFVPPRDHPSATSALTLGLFGVFCLGAFLGVPAIILGRGTVSAAAHEPQRWRGVGKAKAAIVLGWVSVVETAFVIARFGTMSVTSAIFGISAALIGLALLGLSAVKSLPSPIAAISGTLRRAPLAVGLPLAGALAGSAFGLIGAISTARATARECAAERSKYTESARTENFVATRMAIDALERACRGSGAETGTMRRDVDAKEIDAKKRREAEIAAEKETSAVANFPEAGKSVIAAIRLAQSEASQGKFESAGDVLHNAERKLEDFKDTSVEQTKEYTDLAKQITDRLRAIQPQLDRIADKRMKEQRAAEEKLRKEQAAAALLDAIRGPVPINSPWDGSVLAVESYLKSAMHDPDSYDHVRTTVPIADGEYWTVVSSFRGKNAFGGVVLNTKKFYIQQGQVVKVSDIH